MRYINKQQHYGSCGPTSIMNAMKWLGRKGISYRKYFPLLTKYGYSSKKGIPNYGNISKMLDIYDIKYKFKHHPKMQDIEKELDKGNGILLNFFWYWKGRKSGHYVFIDRHTEKSFYAINFEGERSTKENNWARKRLLSKWFTSSKRWKKDRPVMWTIKK